MELIFADFHGSEGAGFGLALIDPLRHKILLMRVWNRSGTGVNKM